jgi:glycine cleavage system H protein
MWFFRLCSHTFDSGVEFANVAVQSLGLWTRAFEVVPVDIFPRIPMSNPSTIRIGATCVWMDAGILTYKLCDRGFDCEHCPLDAAIRGAPCVSESPCGETGRRARTLVEFPADRLYSSSHCWLRPVEATEDRIRFGLDSLATSMMPDPVHARIPSPPLHLERDQRICELRFGSGVLRIGMPITARIVGWNRALERNPRLIVDEPYGDGWIAELTTEPPVKIDHLFSADAIREQTRLDCRHIRRRIAFLLMADDRPCTHSASNGGLQLYTDLRECVGWPRFMELLQDLVS